MKGNGGFDGRRGTMGVGGGGDVGNIHSFSESLFNLHNLVLMGNGGKVTLAVGVEKRWKGTGGIAMGDKK